MAHYNQLDIRTVCRYIVVMTWMSRSTDFLSVHSTFKFIVSSREIIESESDTTAESTIVCSALCSSSLKCSSVNFRNDDRRCQLSRQKGTCMEIKQARIIRGFKMYEKQVINI
jgi:hypothetical protein